MPSASHHDISLQYLTAIKMLGQASTFRSPSSILVPDVHEGPEGLPHLVGVAQEPHRSVSVDVDLLVLTHIDWSSILSI